MYRYNKIEILCLKMIMLSEALIPFELADGAYSAPLMDTPLMLK